MEQDKVDFPQTQITAQDGGMEEDFMQMLEESERTVKPGEIVRGRVVRIGAEFVTVDIGYKSEGQIPLSEFRARDGRILVNEGDEIEVFFDAADAEQEGIVLSRAKAEQFRVWRDIENAYTNKTPIEGNIVGKVKGGLKVDIGVAAFLPGPMLIFVPSVTLIASLANAADSPCSNITVRALMWWCRAALF